MGMNFGEALLHLKRSKRVYREGWEAGTFIYLVVGSKFAVDREPLLNTYRRGTHIEYCPHIDIRMANGQCTPWAIPQIDVLAEDWKVIKEE